MKKRIITILGILTAIPLVVTLCVETVFYLWDFSAPLPNHATPPTKRYPIACLPPFDVTTFWDAFPLPDDHEIEQVVEGIDLAFSTACLIAC